jgi:hypothetical protein
LSINGTGGAVTEESLERYGGILAAPTRHRWRRVPATVGAIHAIAALAAVAVFFVHHAAAADVDGRTSSP